MEQEEEGTELREQKISLLEIIERLNAEEA